MEKKIGKSVVATGIAATTIISGGLTHQVHADELVESTVTAPQATEVTGKPVTAADVAVAQENAEAAKAKAEELEPKVTANKEAVDGLKTKVEALPDSDAVDAKITTAKEAINNSIDLVKDSVAALKTVVQGSEDGTTKGLDAKIAEAKQEATDNLAAAKQALEHSIEQAATAGLPEETKQDIQAAKQAATKLTEITSKVDDAVSKATDADTKVGTLETKVTALESFKTDAEPKLAAIDTVKEAVDTLKDTTVPAIDARVTTLEGKAAPTDFTEDQKTKLDEILTGKHFATADDISNAKTELKNELATQDSVTQLTNQAITTAEGKVTEAKTELEGKINELGTKVDGIHVPDTSTLATKAQFADTLSLKQIDPIIDVKQSKDIQSPYGNFSYTVGVKIGGVKIGYVTLNDSTTTMEDGTVSKDYAGYYMITNTDPITSLKVDIYVVADDHSSPIIERVLEIDPSKFVNEDKYIFVAETNDNGDLVSRNITAVTKLEDNISDYNFKIDLKASTGTSTNLIIGMLASTAGEEFADLAACSTVNGQYNLFAKTEFTEISDKLNSFVRTKEGAVIAGSSGNNFKAIKLKTPLTPDGQNDTYVVTYHRPVNHG